MDAYNVAGEHFPTALTISQSASADPHQASRYTRTLKILAQAYQEEKWLWWSCGRSWTLKLSFSAIAKLKLACLLQFGDYQQMGPR